MSITSINSNAAALAAQLNIGNANSATANEVSALSSGNRIVQASNDVAALSVGTALASQINTLNTTLTVASQGSSLLQVADGALAQIQSILQQQQSVATQAQSGSLSSTQLGFLDQEFQTLSQQIDQLASSTNFNGVNLINGSISGNAAITTNTSIASTAVTNSVAIFAETAAAANADTITINGLTVTFTTAVAGTAAASGKVVSGSTAADTGANLAQYLNSLGAAQLANLQFTSVGGNVNAVYVGGALQGKYTITTSSSSTTTISATGATAVLALTGATLTNNVNGVGLNRYTASGSVSGSILTSTGAGTTQFGSAIDVSLVKNNLAFIGQFGGDSIGAITGSYAGAQDHAVFSVKVGADTYTSGSVALTTAVPTAITFTGVNSNGAADGGSFTLNLAGSALTAATINGQSDVNNVTAQINNALSGITINQNRTVTSFQNGNIVTDASGTQIGNLNGASIQLNGHDFSNVNISSLTITAPAIGSTDAKFTAVINGDTYQSVAGLGNQIATSSVIGLQDITNPGNYLAITTGANNIASNATTALDLSTQANADLVAAGIKSALGLTDASASLSFQVGSVTTDTIGVSIGSASTNTLFSGKSLDVKTQADAAVAANTLTDAINTVSSLRANVGALEQRFTYATNAISSAVQNEGAAKSTLLDTDVASESTQFATSQVQLQAGIAVLAQANQLPQNLLKLIA